MSCKKGSIFIDNELSNFFNSVTFISVTTLEDKSKDCRLGHFGIVTSMILQSDNLGYSSKELLEKLFGCKLDCDASTRRSWGKKCGWTSRPLGHLGPNFLRGRLVHDDPEVMDSSWNDRRQTKPIPDNDIGLNTGWNTPARHHGGDTAWCRHTRGQGAHRSEHCYMHIEYKLFQNPNQNQT